MCKLTIATHLFESLNHTGRQAFYRSLGDDERDALYYAATDNLIGRVHLTTKNRIDAKTNAARNTRRGYILPDATHRAENDRMWRSAAWRVLLGVIGDPAHLQPHVDALRGVA